LADWLALGIELEVGVTERSNGDNQNGTRWLNEGEARSVRQAMASEEPGQGITVAGATESETAGLPDAVEDVVEVEGTAESSETASGVIQNYLFHDDDPVREVSVGDLDRLIEQDSNFVWIDLDAFTQENLRSIAEVLHLNPASLRTAMSPWQRPRIATRDQGFFVSATIPRPDDTTYRVYAAELDLFVSDNFLVSAHKQPLPFFDRVMARARQNPGLMQQDSAFLLYIILDELLDYYEGLVEGMNDQIERMEERALEDTSDSFLRDLQRLKRYVYALVRIAGHHREIFTAFTRPDFPFTSRAEMEPYFHELGDRLAQLLDSLDTAREDVNGAFDIYVSHVSHRMNQVMQLLTVVSVTLLPTTIILGFWGTNFQGVPLYTFFGFLAMVAIIAISTGVTLYAIRRKGWL
jgi:magnesium transporter